VLVGATAPTDGASDVPVAGVEDAHARSLRATGDVPGDPPPDRRRPDRSLQVR
jgi:hypothetical protein